MTAGETGDLERFIHETTDEELKSIYVFPTVVSQSVIIPMFAWEANFIRKINGTLNMHFARAFRPFSVFLDELCVSECNELDDKVEDYQSMRKFIVSMEDSSLKTKLMYFQRMSYLLADKIKQFSKDFDGAPSNEDELTGTPVDDLTAAYRLSLIGEYIETTMGLTPTNNREKAYAETLKFINEMRATYK